MANAERLVLIADDDQGVRDALQFALKLEGIDVHVHSGPAELLADADVPRAGCVILEDSMPHMDGLELLRRLRARNNRLPAIMLTNHATPGFRQRAGAAGVHLVLEKPLLDTALIDTLLIILGDA